MNGHSFEADTHTTFAEGNKELVRRGAESLQRPLVSIQNFERGARGIASPAALLSGLY